MKPIGMAGILRLGLVQAMLGAIVVLTTSTINRVMVVELALPALIPGLLVALHHAVQLTRPRMGYGSDVGRRRTPWIMGGMAVLALGGFGAAAGTAWAAENRSAGLALATGAFLLVGLGVSAAGTSLLALLARLVDAPRRGSAAATVWVMMIVGFAVTAGLAGRFLDPFTPARLMAVSGTVSVLAFAIACLALGGLEGSARRGAEEVAGAASAPGEANAAAAAIDARGSGEPATSRPPFLHALAEVWAEADARRFTIFVFVSMVAYSMQDLILEPFAGMLWGLSPGATTQLSGLQHGGTLAGMLLAALAGRRVRGVFFGSLQAWTVIGCLASAVALAGLVLGGMAAPHWPLAANVFALGAANGAFSIAAIGCMMGMAGEGRAQREGTRLGLWGAAQAIGFAVGGLFGAAASDAARAVLGSAAAGYGAVFAAEAVMFLVAAALAAHPSQRVLRTPRIAAPGAATAATR
jgi:BCD family chlorophyll transporter-like MFS transporter